jgi:hypothetical protein
MNLKGRIEGSIPGIISRQFGYLAVTGRRGSHIVLDNRFTDGGEVVSLTRRPPFTPQEVSWYSFLLETESTPGP